MQADGWGDRAMLTITLVLLGIGATTVFSASSFVAMSAGESPYAYLIKHCFRVAAGLALLGIAWAVPLGLWRRAAPFLAAAGLVGLAAVLVPSPLRVSARSADEVYRWLRIGPVLFQPSEFARVFMIIYLASVLAKKGEKLKDFRYGFLPPVVAVGLFGGLIAGEPSLGSAVTTVAVGMALVFAAGARLVHLGVTFIGASAAGALAALLYLHDYQWARITAFLSGNPDPLNEGWQVWQSKIALGSGGVLGRWGDSMQRLHYLPDSHTDFIFSSLGEQWGFVGTTIVLGLMAALLWRGMRAALAAECPFARLLATGLAASLGIYVVVNVAVATGSVPTTGQPFPFMSYGGSALAVNLFSVGLLLNVTRAEAGRAHRELSAYRKRGGWARSR